jgi:hypothetical protein
MARPSAKASVAGEGASGAPFSLEALFSPAFWAELCPFLHVDGALFREQPLPAVVLAPPDEAALGSRLAHDGFRTLPVRALSGTAIPALSELLGRGVARLVAAGLPASAIILYDEAIALQAALRPLVSRAVGGKMEALGDWYAFHVDAASGGRGWPPHRDRPMSDPRAIAASLRVGGAPRYITAWIALSDATPETSCLYFMPRWADPG